MEEEAIDKLPVLLSIPHGGTRIPKKLRDRVRLSAVDILDDSDAFERQVYDLGHLVARMVTTDVARALVDVNRAPDDLPPENPDGVVKSRTCHQRPIYKAGLEPDEPLIKTLLEKYYEPYHRQIRHALTGADRIELGLDCHTMSDLGPDVAPDPGQKRPMLCLGNVHGKTCSQEMIDRLADCFRQAFGFDTLDVTQNRPFAGAYITQTYGGNPVPWIQIELNQSLYLEPRESDGGLLRADPMRVQEAREKFGRTICLFFGQG